MSTVTWKGLREANAALRRLPEFTRDAVQQVIDVTAFQIYRGAKRRAPRDTGLLQNSLDWQSRSRSLSAIVGVQMRAYYWRFLEYGTVKLPARPFLRPAVEAERGDHLNRLNQALEKTTHQVERAQGNLL